MFVLLSLVVCLAAQPLVCETVTPDYAHRDTGEPPTLFECLGPVGQDIARRWLAEHPSYLLRRVRCSVASDPGRLRDRIESPHAWGRNRGSTGPSVSRQSPALPRASAPSVAMARARAVECARP